MYALCVIIGISIILGSEVVAVVDSIRSGSPSIYHINCEFLITGHLRRCDYCKKYRKSLSAMACRNQTKESRTDPSSHTPYISLSTPEKNERLSRLHKENRKLSNQVAQSKERLSSATSYTRW